MAEFNIQDHAKEFVGETITNTKSDIIIITEDKLENILLKHEKRFSKAIAWSTPLAIFLTLLMVLITSDFKDILGITKDTWFAIFLIFFVASIIWTFIAAYNALKFSKQATIKFLINKIKDKSETSAPL